MSRIPHALLPIVLAVWGHAGSMFLPVTPEDLSQSGAVLRVAGSQIHVFLPHEQLQVSSPDLLDWAKSAADAVVHYYGRFPVAQLSLRVRARGGARVGPGVTFPEGGGLIRVAVGREANVLALKHDWVLTHEMIHLAFPSMRSNHHWIEEGISTYVEPVSRAQVGQMPAAAVWKQFMVNMLQGEPAAGDRGLDHTPTWGRTYWGGAMFCLVADVEIRERTHNRKGLQDSLRAILDHGGIITQDWPIEKALAIGDQATRSDVLRSLYEKWRDQPVDVDLSRLWQKLGVALAQGEVVFDDNAPDAAIRKRILGGH